MIAAKPRLKLSPRAKRNAAMGRCPSDTSDLSAPRFLLCGLCVNPYPANGLKLPSALANQP